MTGSQGEVEQKALHQLLKQMGKVSPEDLRHLRLLAKSRAQAWFAFRIWSIAFDVADAGMSRYWKRASTNPQLLEDDVEAERVRNNCTESAISNYRRTHKRAKENEPELIERTEENLAPQAVIQTEVEKDEDPRKVLLDQLLSRLSPEMRTVLVKNRLEDRTYAEIAGQLREEPKTVEKRGQRAYEKLKQLALGRQPAVTP